MPKLGETIEFLFPMGVYIFLHFLPTPELTLRFLRA
jgi:hypothetical protein